MEPTKPQLPTGLEKYMFKLPLYTRVGFGLIIVFGMVGNCAGKREGSIVVFALTAIMWTCLRILQEALASWKLLGELKKWEESQQNPPPAPPPSDDAET